MRCNRCGNEDDRYFFNDHGVWYCRKCVGFGRLNVGEMVNVIPCKKKKLECDYKLKYPLTEMQTIVIKRIMKYLHEKKDVLVYAACGAGKTELTMEAIKEYLQHGKKVCFAISRRQVVLEIKDRMQKAFPMLHVIAVCEGFTDIVDGDLIVCTMHQLYRYQGWFDLLVMDEVDAFPYRDNEVLERIANNACIGQKLMLTATPSKEMLNKVEKHQWEMVELFKRPHGFPLIEPKVYCMPVYFQFIKMLDFIHQCKKENVQSLIFIPTILMANRLYRILHIFLSCMIFTSKTVNKEEVIQNFHDKKYDFLITTTILERGITIKGIYVLILCADHPVFQEASLIQMIGRVGRNIDMPTGKGVFLCKHKTEDIQRCILAIQKMNQDM